MLPGPSFSQRHPQQIHRVLLLLPLGARQVLDCLWQVTGLDRGTQGRDAAPTGTRRGGAGEKFPGGEGQRRLARAAAAKCSWREAASISGQLTGIRGLREAAATIRDTNLGRLMSSLE
jgi:hypothetical protein